MLFTLLAAPFAASASVPTHTIAAACGDTYTVRPGDSLWSISLHCAVPVATITRLNHLGPYLQPGQLLQLTDPFDQRQYVVQPGDTISAIAQRLGIAPATLAADNDLRDPNLLRVGQVLHWRLADAVSGVPTMASAGTAASGPAPASAGTSSVSSAGTYVVRPGDSLWSIALAQHVTPEALAAANGISDPRTLQVGRVLRLPAAAAVSAPAAGATSAPASGATTVVSAGTYRVKTGDSLWSIAQSLGLTPDALAEANNLQITSPIQPGQILRYSVVVYSGPSRAEIGAVLAQQAALVGIDATLLDAVAWRESSWRMVDAPDGGIGVMQLMPATVAWLKATYLPGAWDPHDLSANVHAGAVLLAVYSRQYGGDATRIATAYHGGQGAVGAPGTAEMRRYVNAVLAFRQAFATGALPVY